MKTVGEPLPIFYEQTFNNLVNGDLNGQDSWSGAGEYDVQSTLAYEGTKAVQVNALNTSKLISRTVPSFTSGQMYFSVRRDTNGDGSATLFEKVVV